MKTLILSAGQGSRLLPLTKNCPKCLLPVGPKSLIEWQIDHLWEGGVDEVVVVTGFQAHMVDRELEKVARPGLTIRTLFNPFFHVADNLATCWMARGEMTEDMIIINGDTIFEPQILRRLIELARAPLNIAMDRKREYDAEDMKIQLEGSRVLAVGKTLPARNVGGEAIGMMLLRADGPKLFADALDTAIRAPDGVKWWYLKVVSKLAEWGYVEAVSIEGLSWGEVDYPQDLDLVRGIFADAMVQQTRAHGRTQGSLHSTVPRTTSR